MEATVAPTEVGRVANVVGWQEGLQGGVVMDLEEASMEMAHRTLPPLTRKWIVLGQGAIR